MREAISLVQPNARSQRHHASPSTAKAEVVIEMDAVLIKRLLCNLLSNAVDASPAGSQIEIQLAPLPKTELNRDWYRLKVIDHGEGISPENLQRVFTPYFTTKNTGDGKRGFGLGLAIAPQNRAFARRQSEHRQQGEKRDDGAGGFAQQIEPGAESAANGRRADGWRWCRHENLAGHRPQPRPGRRRARMPWTPERYRVIEHADLREDELRLTGAVHRRLRVRRGPDDRRADPPHRAPAPRRCRTAR